MVVYIGRTPQDRNQGYGGDWRIIIDGDDLKFQRLENRTWVTKDTIAG